MGVNHKICIALPTNRGLRPKCLQSVLEMLAYKSYDYHILVSTEGFTTAENRTWLTAQAVKAQCTHILFLDDDMVYEPDSLERLLAHDKEIVGAKYHNRRGGENGGEVIEYLDEKSDTDLFKCNALGGGLLLVKTGVFIKTPQPWFWYKINESGMVTMSNDWFFCEKARESGYEIWCDPTLKPGHIGKKEYA